VTLFALDPDDTPSEPRRKVEAWLTKWRDAARVANRSGGGWEHCWDVEAPLSALRELPKRLFCISDWATYPAPLDGPTHKAWESHFDDEKDNLGNPKSDA
jgi:hypothetical protein